MPGFARMRCGARAQQDDRDATYADVAACADTLAAVWAQHGAAGNFTHTSVPGKTHMAAPESLQLVAWLDSVAKGTGVVVDAVL
jgi:hypothetical protein